VLGLIRFPGRRALILGLSAVVGLFKSKYKRRSVLIYRVSSQYLVATNNKRPVVYPAHQAPFVGANVLVFASLLSPGVRQRLAIFSKLSLRLIASTSQPPKG
jgi:hypothetical protein